MAADVNDKLSNMAKFRTLARDAKNRIFQKNKKDIEKTPIQDGLDAEMESINRDLSPVDGRVNEKIDRNKQHSFASDLYANQAEQSILSSKKEYAANPKAWVDSKTSRSRLVVIEAAEWNIKDLAKITYNASPVDRVLIVGLTGGLKKQLATDLKKIHNDSIEAHPDEPINFHNGLSGGLLGNDLKENINKASLEQLLGPHIYKDNLDTDFDSMSVNFPQFDANLEEIVCFGETDVLSENTAALARKIDDSGIPIFSVKSSEIKDSEVGLWHASAAESKNFLRNIADGKSAVDFIGKENDNGRPVEIKLCPSLNESFGLKGFKDQAYKHNMDVDSHINQEDLDYFKKIFFDEAVYPSNISPNNIGRLVSKAGSKLNAMKASVVAEELMPNVYDSPRSSAVELEFAVGNMTNDGGGDLIKEALAKKVSYKNFYDDVLQNSIEHNVNNESLKVLKEKAFIQTINSYKTIENENKQIQTYQNGPAGAETWRDFGLLETEKVQKKNRTALTLLKGMRAFFAGGIGLSAIGFGLAIAGLVGAPITLGASLSLSAVGVSLFTASYALRARSIQLQKKANGIHLTQANIAFSLANEKMFDIQGERNLLLKRDLKQLKAGQTPSLQSNETLRVKPVEMDKGQEKFLVKTLNEIIGAVDTTGGVYKGEVTRTGMLDYTNKLFDTQAERSKASRIEEYSRNLSSWSQSGSSRRRLVVIEPPLEKLLDIDENDAAAADISVKSIADNKKVLENIAKAVFNASPLEKVVVANLNKEQQGILKNAIKQEWIATYAGGVQAAEHPIKKGILNKIKNLISGRKRETNTEIPNDTTPKAAFIEFYNQNIKDDNATSITDTGIITALEEMSLSQLLGPHQYMDDLDTSFESMSQKFPDFDVNLEEVLYYGSSEKLVRNSGDLAANIEGGVPVLAIKSSEIVENEEGQWRGSAKNSNTFLDAITEGKSAIDLLGKESNSQFENIILDKTYESLMNKETLIGLSKELGLEVNEKLTEPDLDYFKEILFREALYPADTSPEAIVKTTSKAMSKLGAQAGADVSEALTANYYGKPKNTKVEVDYAIAFLVADAGNDMIRESVDKKTVYKQSFEKLRNHFLSNGDSAAKATQKAFVHSINMYLEIEKNNATVKNLLHGDKGAENFREYSMQTANEADKLTKAGVGHLFRAPGHFAAGVASEAVGLVLLAKDLPIVGPFISFIAVPLIGDRIITKYRAMKKIARANRELLPKANFMSAQANGRHCDANMERKNIAQRHLEEITGDGNNSLRKGPEVNLSLGEARQVIAEVRQAGSSVVAPDLGTTQISAPLGVASTSGTQNDGGYYLGSEPVSAGTGVVADSSIQDQEYVPSGDNDSEDDVEIINIPNGEATPRVAPKPQTGEVPSQKTYDFSKLVDLSTPSTGGTSGIDRTDAVAASTVTQQRPASDEQEIIDEFNHFLQLGTPPTSPPAPPKALTRRGEQPASPGRRV